MTPCTWYDHEQGSPEWLQARCGLLTASRMADAMDKGAKRENLKLEILSERFTSRPTEFFVNYNMRWGTDNEPLARQAYMDYTGRHVDTCGLAVSNEIEFFGASPDGLVGDKGLLEIKCPTSQTFFKWVLEGVVPEQHRLQMIAQLAVTGREWCDFVAFDPRYPAEQDLFIRHFKPYRAEIDAVKDGARKFLAEVAAMERMFIKAMMVE